MVRVAWIPLLWLLLLGARSGGAPADESLVQLDTRFSHHHHHPGHSPVGPGHDLGHAHSPGHQHSHAHSPGHHHTWQQPTTATPWTDQLDCYTGYKQTPAGLCEPECPYGCEFGTCAAPNTCACNAGCDLKASRVHTTPGSCNGGYEDVDGVCVPKCSQVCIYSICTAPDVCTCLQGYQHDGVTLKHVHVCHPTCSEPCVNGVCSEPGVCACLSGYSPSPTRRNVCDRSEPAPCSNTCNNGDCDANGVCVCREGYRRPELENTCWPTCSRYCGAHGYCVVPDTCVCMEGYEKSLEDAYTCRPKCDGGCRNGVCGAPDFCVCDEHYVKDTTTNRCILDDVLIFTDK